MASRRTAKHGTNRRKKLSVHNGIYDEEFVVEQVLDRKFDSGSPLYKVKWLGYPLSQCTWEPVEHLSNVPEMVAEYEAAHKQDATANAQVQAEVPKIYGSLEKDLPVRVMAGRKAEGKVACTVEWEKRPDGVKPLPSAVMSDELKDRFPDLLLDFYESKLIF